MFTLLEFKIIILIRKNLDIFQKIDNLSRFEARNIKRLSNCFSKGPCEEHC